jgi:hypothetical protein
MNKYNAKKTTVDGITFDSKREAERYCELKLLQRAGEISELRLQVPFELQPGFTVNGKKIRPIHYIADFMYTQNGTHVVEDAKGHRTKEYMLKRKMFAYRYGQEVREV